METIISRAFYKPDLVFIHSLLNSFERSNTVFSQSRAITLSGNTAIVSPYFHKLGDMAIKFPGSSMAVGLCCFRICGMPHQLDFSQSRKEIV